MRDVGVYYCVSKVYRTSFSEVYLIAVFTVLYIRQLLIIKFGTENIVKDSPV